MYTLSRFLASRVRNNSLYGNLMANSVLKNWNLNNLEKKSKDSRRSIVFTKYSAVLESVQSRLKISFTIKAYIFVGVHASFPANLCTFFKVARTSRKKK